jgi:chemotaxis family two-component system response regulator Rcp1
LSFREAYVLLQILLVEDSPGDCRLTREVFREANPSVVVNVAHDGIEAMLYLGKKGTHANACRPDLILLDLNIPQMDGRQVLARIKTDYNLKTIPTVVLTTSHDENDIETCYELDANCYLTKPVELEAFEDLVRNINNFWLDRASLPRRS